MSTLTEYAERVSKRYGALERVDQSTVPWDEGYVPLYARRGPRRAGQDWAQFQEELQGARNRVHEEQIKELLSKQAELELLWTVPYGVPVPIADVVRAERRLVLIAEPGAGKTTALRYLAAHRPVSRMRATAEGRIEQEELIPVLVDLPELGDSSLPEYLSGEAGRSLSLDLSVEACQQLLESGKALVCLDGLDELPDQQSRARMMRRIETLVDRYPQCQYVVTVRPSTYEPPFSRDSFAHYVLVPWQESVVSDVEEAWNKALDDWRVENPESPHYVERHRLWRHLALAMRLEGRRSASLQEAQEWLVEEMLNDKRLKITKRRVPEEAEALLRDSTPHLKMVRNENGQLSFAPRLLHDILAARALEAMCLESSVKAAWEEVRQSLWASNLWDTLALTSRFLARDEPKTWNRLMLQALEAGEEDALEPVLRRHLLFAAAALGDPRNELDRATRRRVIDGLMEWLTDSEAVARQDSFYALSRLGGESYAAEQVLDKCKDTSLDAWSREAALVLLGTLGPGQAAEAIDLLQGTLDKIDESERLRLAAADTLGAIGARGTLDARLQASLDAWLLERARNPDLPIGLRVAVTEALSLIYSQTHNAVLRDAFMGLSQGMNGDERVPYSVQTAATRGLCQVVPSLRDEELAAQLWAMARDEKVDDSVRTLLAEMLGKMGNAADAGRVLMQIAQSPTVYPPGQRDALMAIGRLRYAEQDVVDQMVKIAETTDRSTKDFVRLAAALSLGELGLTAQSVTHLLMLVADKSIYRSTRIEALAHFGQMGYTGDEELDNAMLSVLQIWVTESNTTEDVQENAIDSLRMLRASREDVIKDIVGTIQDKRGYPRVRRYAAEALAGFPIGDEEVVAEALSTTFYDPDETSDLLRVPLAKLLWTWSHDEPALTYLKEAAAKSYMALVRYKAGIVLGEFGEMEPAVDALLKLAQDAQIADPIRCDSLRALSIWKTSDETVVDAVTAIAQDIELEPNVRQAAYSCLRSMLSV